MLARLYNENRDLMLVGALLAIIENARHRKAQHEQHDRGHE